MTAFFRRHWFALGLIAVFGLVLADITTTAAACGKWMKARHGPDLVIVLIFFFSGLLLEGRLLRAGMKDFTGTALAFITIFVVSPLVALGLCLLPLSSGLKIGLLLVAVMPCTLSSGVVMTATAGGNMAHALLITILANSCAVVTVPVVLTWCLSAAGLASGDISIDRGAIMLTIAAFVVLPLLAGLLLRLMRRGVRQAVESHQALVQGINQGLVLLIVFMAASQSRETILAGYQILSIVLLLVAVFHSVLLGSGAGLIRLAALEPGRRESVLFMGAQKTLPLCIILQLTLFPQYGAALVVCVVHHLVHLIIDGLLVGAVKARTL